MSQLSAPAECLPMEPAMKNEHAYAAPEGTAVTAEDEPLTSQTEHGREPESSHPRQVDFIGRAGLPPVVATGPVELSGVRPVRARVALSPADLPMMAVPRTR